MLRQHIFRVQADGGANRSVTPNRYMIHTSCDIPLYKIDGISDRIVCTGKGIFHIICEDGSVLPVTILYSKEATETVVSPKDTVFSNANTYDSW